MCNAVVTLKEIVERSLNTANWKDLEDWITDNVSFAFDYSIYNETPLSDEQVFDYIYSLLAREDFLKNDHSSNVLLILEYDWNILTASQKERLMPALITAMPRMKDPLSWFVIAELLGRFYANAYSLDALQQLKSSLPDEPRSLIAMGLQQLIQHTNDEDVARQARNTLLSMKKDPSQQVREETALALMRLDA